jgi:predicted RNA-binding Zn ribbon-like protein
VGTVDAQPDPRPLVGEPRPLDLLNTEWIAEGRRHDLLEDLAGVRVWLATNDISAPATVPVRDNLVEARGAVRATLSEPSDADARRQVDQVLSHARLRFSLGAGHDPVREVEVDDQAWLPAAIAALDLLDLLRDRPDRIRPCAHPDCILWFLDTSRNGTRRWCSMAACGNRAKAQRHYSRVRDAG